MPEITTPIFEFKSHIGIDQCRGFIRTWSASGAAHYDGRDFSNLIDPADTGSALWADTAYRSQINRTEGAARPRSPITKIAGAGIDSAT